MKKVSGMFCICLCVGLMVRVTNPPAQKIGVAPAIAYFKTQAAVFSQSASQLQTAINGIGNKNSKSLVNARNALKNCRLAYKRIEFFLEYFFKSAALIYNGAPKYEIEEPFMEYQEPIGLQVIEGMLFERNAGSKKEALRQQADAISSSATDLPSLLYAFDASDKQVLESIRLELIRVMTLGIAGFDAPLLKTGINEAEASIASLQYVLQPFLIKTTAQSDSVSICLASSLQFLRLQKDFDKFDRLGFLTRCLLPLQRHLSLLIEELGLDYNTTGTAINYSSGDLFQPGFLNIRFFPGAEKDTGKFVSELGEKLFFETGLSGNGRINCATCHEPAKHFTDGLARSLAFDGHSPLPRNAPSLLYAGFQHEQFWDGRAKSLEEQIKTVIISPTEMNGGGSAISPRLDQEPEYKELFKKAFPRGEDSLLLLDKLAISLAAFVRSLHPQNSRFDRYMTGIRSTLTAPEIRGFNLFMGKAQCGTCHFAPLFNGLTPPLYNLSELEILGTTRTGNLDKPVLDTDQGRYTIFPIAFYKSAFKTPSIRNASATGPYMHNGGFKTLEEVVEFYNKGGANGLGLKLANQTLSANPLNLSKTEVSDIVSFIKSLEDSVTMDKQELFHYINKKSD